MRFHDTLMTAAAESASVDTPAAAVARYVAAAAVNGGTVSPARQALLVTLVTASMAAGHWQATDDFALLTAEDAGSALTLVKSGRLMTAVAAPTFTADQGYAFNGTTQYLDTGFVPSTMARSMGLGNIRVGVYERTNVAANTDAIGATALAGSQRSIVARPRNSGSILHVQLMSSVNNTSLTGITDSRGLTTQSRAGGATSVQSRKNGVALSDVTGLTVNNAILPDVSLFIGAHNVSGTPGAFRASTIGLAEWGAPLPGGTTAELAWYTALQTFMTAIGANV